MKKLKSIEKLAEVFSEFELNDDQEKALDKFFEEFYSETSKRYEEQYNEKIQKLEAQLEEAGNHTTINEDMVSIEQAERAAELMMADAEKAANMMVEDAEKEFMEKGQVILEQAREDMAQEFGEKMALMLEEVHDELYEKARINFLESNEYKAFENAKNAIAPLIVNEDSSALMKELQELKAQKAHLEEENFEVQKKETIEDLIQEFSEKEQAVIRKFVEKATSEDEIYSRFNEILEHIESLRGDEEVVAEEEEEELEEEEEGEEVVTEDVVFSSSTKEEASTPVDTSYPRMNRVEESIVNRIFATR